MSVGDEVDAASLPTRQPDDDPTRPQAMPWAQYVDSVLSKWHQLLSNDPEENEVQAFLEHHPAMVPGGSGDIGPGGHHGSDLSAVFARPTLSGSGRTLIPDFMWVTRSSGLITPILIEIEKPSKRWFKENGRPTAEFRDAHDQLNDWRAWFEADHNRSIFRDEYLIGGDRYENRPLEPHFVLIYGRQVEFEHGGGHRDPDGLRRKRDTQRAANEAFMTFDALRPRFDHSSSVTVLNEAKGTRAVAFSPVFGTTTSSGSTALLLDDIEGALANTVMITDERRNYLLGRFEHWKSVELAERAARRGPAIQQLGLE